MLQEYRATHRTSITYAHLNKGDSNLYLRRHHEQLTLSVEHRAARSRTGIPLGLRADADALALEVLDHPAPAVSSMLPPSPAARIEQALAEASVPVSLGVLPGFRCPPRVLRRACRMRTARLCEVLATLTASDRIRKTPAGYHLAR